MVLEIFNMNTNKPEDGTITVISVRSLLADLRKMNVNTERDEKVMLAAMERTLMVAAGELTKEDFVGAEEPPAQEPEPEVVTPPEPPKAVPQPTPEPEIVGEVPKPSPAQKQQPAATGKPAEQTIDMDDEFPLR